MSNEFEDNKVDHNNEKTLEHEQSIDKNNLLIENIKEKLRIISTDLDKYINEYNHHLKESKENTLKYISIFHEIINDYTNEINSNCLLLNDVFNKLDLLSNKLPLLEDLYEKVHEMRMILEMIYSSIKKTNTK
jgi:hypothetical protein